MISLDATVSRHSNEEGFVEFDTPSVEGYKRRIMNNPFFYVAQDENSIVGFLASYSDSFLQELGASGDLIGHIMSKPAPFIYSEQLAIRSEHRGQGVSAMLCGLLLEEASPGYRTIWSAIPHKPILNQKSINIHEKAGSELVEEFTTPDGLTFGVYRKILRKG